MQNIRDTMYSELMDETQAGLIFSLYDFNMGNWLPYSLNSVKLDGT